MSDARSERPIDRPSELAVDLDVYRPAAEWYLLDALGVHGVGHAARVLVWANRIGRWMREQGTAVDLEAVLWAAALHDVRRADDDQDAQHGARAASWLRANPTVLPHTLTAAQRRCVTYCCRWHVPDDHQAPRMTAELVCLKDADGLDRVRLGGLDVSYMRTPYAKTLPDLAQALHAASVQGSAAKPWEAVRSQAVRLGVWEVGVVEPTRQMS